VSNQTNQSQIVLNLSKSGDSLKGVVIEGGKQKMNETDESDTAKLIDADTENGYY